MIKESIKFKFKKINFETGKIYYFKYRKYEQDPKPLIIFINHLKGTNPNTGIFWNFIQGINLHYIPIRMRKDVLKIFENKRHKINIRKLVSLSPIKFAFRRYITASTYITNIKLIDDKYFELNKNEHRKMYLPKGVKLNEFNKYMRPRSLR